eukprot:g42557.t1
MVVLKKVTADAQRNHLYPIDVDATLGLACALSPKSEDLLVKHGAVSENTQEGEVLMAKYAAQTPSDDYLLKVNNKDKVGEFCKVLLHAN